MEVNNFVNSTTLDSSALATSNSIAPLDYGFLSGFLSSFGIIFLSEIADKTFILVVFFSTKITKMKLFLIASLALVGMNFIAVLIGYLIPVLLYKWLVEWLAIASFLFMGVWMIYEASQMKLKTVEQKLLKYKKKHENEIEGELGEEADHIQHAHKHKEELGIAGDLKTPLIEKGHKSSGGVSWMLFTSIVFAEFGDRSQISAIFISAAYNFYGVLLGSSLAHVICILIAIYLGLWLGHYLSEKQMNYIGGVLFLIFALQIIYDKYITSYSSAEVDNQIIFS
jgi:putative Ca2+/H+ antiporter (TMEM165/GDT1 family)